MIFIPRLGIAYWSNRAKAAAPFHFHAALSRWRARLAEPISFHLWAVSASCLLSNAKGV